VAEPTPTFVLKPWQRFHVRLSLFNGAVVLAVLALMGVGAIVLARLGVPVGSLPGDLVVQRGSVTVFAPVMSCLVVSIVVNVAIWLLRR
jgi:hypothetical protein